MHSLISVHCHICNKDFETTVQSYKNAKKTGCPHCKKEVCSKTHKNKIVSEQTRCKIGLKASKRPGSLKGCFGAKHPRYKHGNARNLKYSSYLDYLWKNAVRKRCKHKCVITFEGWKEAERFACHHLNSYDIHDDQRYLVENGVYLKREIHKKFHDNYGYGNNTEAQFVEFCMRFYNIDWNLRKSKIFLT